MDSSLTIRFDKPGCDWQATISGVPKELAGRELVAENVVLARANGKNFHSTLVEGTVPGTENKFWQLLSIEHDSGHDKVGDVVIIFRKNPHSKRWMVQVETEDAYITETETFRVWRANRSSVDNIEQSVKRTVNHSGWMYTNTRRLGGKQVKTHFVIAGWSPQLAEQMMDVYDFAETLDGPGLSAWAKAMHVMPDNPAREIFRHWRTPSVEG
jgi:hypothetical protein